MPNEWLKAYEKRVLELKELLGSNKEVPYQYLPYSRDSERRTPVPFDGHKLTLWFSQARFIAGLQNSADPDPFKIIEGSPETTNNNKLIYKIPPTPINHMVAITDIINQDKNPNFTATTSKQLHGLPWSELAVAHLKLHCPLDMESSFHFYQEYLSKEGKGA